MKINEQKKTSFLLGIFCCEQKLQNSLDLCSDKYPDLKKTKDKIKKNKEGSYYKPYSSNKKKIMLYKTFFFLFSLLFFTLFSMSYFKTTNWICSLYFSNSLLAKSLICTLSMTLTLAAFLCAIMTRTEKDVLYHISKNAKKKLRRIIAKKRAELGIGYLFLFGDRLKKARILKYNEYEISNQIDDKLLETLHLLKKIRKTKEVDPEIREDLFNQAILEFHDELHLMIRSSNNCC